MAWKIPFLLLPLQFLSQTNAFTFDVRPVGARQTRVTKGDVIIYDAHIHVSASTPLSVYASVPSDTSDEPIFSIEEFEVVGFGSKLKTTNDISEVVYSRENAARPAEKSQATINLGQVVRNDAAVGASPGDEVVFRVKTRVLDHTSVVDGDKFWLYFGMEYESQSDSVWVIGKSVFIQNMGGPAKLNAVLLNENFPMRTSDDLKFEVKIYHEDSSKSTASSVSIELKVPTWFTLNSYTSASTSPAFTASQTDRTLTINLNEGLKVGQSKTISLGFAITQPSVKGKLMKAHFVGDLTYSTTDETSCTRTMTKNNVMHKTVRFYSHEATCDNQISLADMMSSSMLVGFSYGNAVNQHGNYWQPWHGTTQLVDDFLQINFVKMATVKRIRLSGARRKFVKTLHISHSKNGANWQYVLDHFTGKNKDFEANKDGNHMALIELKPVLETRFLRLHLRDISPAGAAMSHLQVYGCKDDANDLSYSIYGRGYVPVDDGLYLCNVRPNAKLGKPNCYYSKTGQKWIGLDPRVKNILAVHTTTLVAYGRGITESGDVMYLEVSNPLQTAKVISQAAWDAVEAAGGLRDAIVIPTVSVTGDTTSTLTNTQIVVGSYTYVATREGLLRNNVKIASWTQHTPY